MQISDDIIGDADGPLGRKRDGAFTDGPSVAGILQALLGHATAAHVGGGFGGVAMVPLGPQPGSGGAPASGAATASVLPVQLPLFGLGSRAYPTLTPRFPTPVSALPPPPPEGGDAAAAAAQGTPSTIASFCAWYAAGSAEIAAEGSALAESLVEVGTLCGAAYASFEALCHALMVGDKKASKGHDLWTEELRYRRAARAALCVKHRYLQAMASLFDRYRRLEQARSEVLAGGCRRPGATGLLRTGTLPTPVTLADAAEKYGAAVSRVFERVSVKGVAESVRCLATHADFCKAIEEDSAQQVGRGDDHEAW